MDRHFSFFYYPHPDEEVGAFPGEENHDSGGHGPFKDTKGELGRDEGEDYLPNGGETARP
jgi:hypothetical protein